MIISYDGLLAGVIFLNEHCDGFDIGTGNNFRTQFIHDLLSEIFRASGITIDIAEARQDVQTQNSLEDCLDKEQLLAFHSGPDGEHLLVKFDFHSP